MLSISAARNSMESRGRRAEGAVLVSPALQRGEKGFCNCALQSRRDGALRPETATPHALLTEISPHAHHTAPLQRLTGPAPKRQIQQRPDRRMRLKVISAGYASIPRSAT